MLFREQENSNIWVAEKYLFLPDSAIKEQFIKQVESLNPLEKAIVKIGLLPSFIQTELESIILTEDQKKLLSISQKQYRDIFRWLGSFAFPNEEVENKLKKSESNLVKPFADYLWKMLQVIETCIRERKIGENSSSDLIYLLWFDMAQSQFLESINNGGFFMPLPNDQSNCKHELIKIWDKDVTPRYNDTQASLNDFSMFSTIDNNLETWEKRGHRIFFDDCLKWAKENTNYIVITAITDLLKQEKRLIAKINNRKGSGMYQVLTIHSDGIRVTGRTKPKGFGNKTQRGNKGEGKGEKKN